MSDSSYEDLIERFEKEFGVKVGSTRRRYRKKSTEFSNDNLNLLVTKFTTDSFRINRKTRGVSKGRNNFDRRIRINYPDLID